MELIGFFLCCKEIFTNELSVMLMHPTGECLVEKNGGKAKNGKFHSYIQHNYFTGFFEVVFYPLNIHGPHYKFMQT